MADLIEKFSESIKAEILRHLEAEQATWPRGQFDFCLIHSDPDFDRAAAFRDGFCAKYDLTGIMESDEEMANIGQEFSRLEEMIRRSTKIFFFVTKNFKEDYNCIVQKNELLAMHVRNKSVHIVPIYAENDDTRHIPIGLNGMISFKLYLPRGDNTRIANTFNEETRGRKHDRQKAEEATIESMIYKCIPEIVRNVLAAHKKREAERRRADDELQSLLASSSITAYDGEREETRLSDSCSSDDDDNGCASASGMNVTRH